MNLFMIHIRKSHFFLENRSLFRSFLNPSKLLSDHCMTKNQKVTNDLSEVAERATIFKAASSYNVRKIGGIEGGTRLGSARDP